MCKPPCQNCLEDKMAILSRAVQDAITEEIRDVVADILKVNKGAADDQNDLYQSICYVAEFTCRNLFFRDLIDREAAVKVFEATGGSMEDIERWTKECKPGCGHTRRPPPKMDDFMREDIRERAHSLGVATTLPELTLAWVDPVLGVKISSHVNPEHAMNLLGIIEQKQEEQLDEQG
jgi:hypothetical protein